MDKEKKKKRNLVDQKKKEEEEFTRRLKPVTLVREVAMATPEREISSKWPAITMEITWRRYWETATATIGAAMELNFFVISVDN